MEDRTYGDGTPVLEIVLNPGEVVIGPSGEVAWMTESIRLSPVNPAQEKRRRRAKRGEDEPAPPIELTEYSADNAPGMVAFACRQPGKVVPIEVQPHPGMTYTCPVTSVLAVQDGVEMTTLPDAKELRPGRYGGGLRMMGLAGLGRAWIALGGEVVSYELRPDEAVRVHPDHLGLMQETVKWEFTPVKDVVNPAFGGPLQLIQLTGPGRVWLQSLGYGRLATVIDDYEIPVEAIGEPQRERGVIRSVLFPRP